ncbi:MAG: hypothetical protein DRP01_02550 [Archaeoglobales archaeon]|nr:MAG: hypothetical protein DRP01_02550 [Archaeoglobales archaeon]
MAVAAGAAGAAGAGAIAGEVAEEATSVLSHLINIIRQALAFIYDAVKTILYYMAEKPLAFATVCVNLAIIFGP